VIGFCLCQGEEMNHVRNRCLIVALLVLPCVPARAQTSTTYSFPEFDAYFRLNSSVRFVFQAKEYIQNGGLVQARF
jgi:hypothetical protein